MRLAGRCALVTGAASGIGKAAALALAREGARVAAADIDAAGARTVAEAIAAAGGAVLALACDVRREQDIADAVAAAVAWAGALHVMVNNAGIAPPLTPIAECDADAWDKVIAVNLRGVFLGTKHAAQAMLRHRAGGSIVNVASAMGLGPSPRLGAYGAAKAGVIQLTQTAALELGPAGIRVNAVCPGWTETPILGKLDRAPLAAGVPLRRLGTPEEIADAIVYLASDRAAYVTGSVFRIDGGLRV